MKITKIEELEYGLLILVDTDYEYYIPNSDFDRTIADNMSNWINQLLEKTWSDIDSLYKIASILCKYDFESKIDWLFTFTMVEARKSANHTYDIDIIKAKLKQYNIN
jgi:hypothetical protein